MTTLAEELAAMAQKRRPAIGITLPSFALAPQETIAPTDVMGAYALQQAARNAAYQGQVAQANSGNSALAGLGGTGLSAAAVFF